MSNLPFAIEGLQKKAMTLDKYRHWVVSLCEDVDNGDDDDDHRYSNYGYHYLGYCPSYGGNVLDISIDPYDPVYVGVYVCLYICR